MWIPYGVSNTFLSSVLLALQIYGFRGVEWGGCTPSLDHRRALVLFTGHDRCGHHRISICNKFAILTYRQAAAWMCEDSTWRRTLSYDNRHHFEVNSLWGKYVSCVRWSAYTRLPAWQLIISVPRGALRDVFITQVTSQHQSASTWQE